MKLLDASHPFFRPLWRRMVVTGVCSGWALVELAWGSPVWALIFGAMAALCIWEFFVAWEKDDPE